MSQLACLVDFDILTAQHVSFYITYILFASLVFYKVSESEFRVFLLRGKLKLKCRLMY